jgi:predicted HTH domain antitoxin
MENSQKHKYKEFVNGMKRMSPKEYQEKYGVTDAYDGRLELYDFGSACVGINSFNQPHDEKYLVAVGNGFEELFNDLDYATRYLWDQFAAKEIAGLSDGEHLIEVMEHIEEISEQFDYHKAVYDVNHPANSYVKSLENMKWYLTKTIKAIADRVSNKKIADDMVVLEKGLSKTEQRLKYAVELLQKATPEVHDNTELMIRGFIKSLRFNNENEYHDAVVEWMEERGYPQSSLDEIPLDQFKGEHLADRDDLIYAYDYLV